MKKTLLVTLDYAPALGGVAAYWSRVTESLSAKEWLVLTPPAAGQQEHPQVFRKPLFFTYLWPRWLRAVLVIGREYRRNHCEFICVGQVLPLGSAVYLLHRFLGVPYVVQLYGMDLAAASLSKRKTAMVRRILGGAQAIIVNSEATARQAADFGVTRGQIHIIYPVPKAIDASPQDVEAIRGRYGLGDKKILLTLGRLVERKGQDLVIKALPAILSKHPEAVYVIAGDGPFRPQLEALARQGGLPVIFVGAVSDDEKRAWLAACDLFIMPARPLPGDVEGFGMVYLEAGSAGKPVIAGNSGGASEAVQQGKTGLCVDPTSAPAIGEAVLTLFDDPRLAKGLGDGGKQAFAQKWNWPEMMQRLKSCFL